MNVAFIEEYGRALLSTDLLNTYSYTNIFEFSSSSEGGDDYKTEHTEAIIGSDGYLYYLLFPQVDNTSRILLVRVNVQDPSSFSITQFKDQAEYNSFQTYTFTVLEPDS